MGSKFDIWPGPITSFACGPVNRPMCRSSITSVIGNCFSWPKTVPYNSKCYISSWLYCDNEATTNEENDLRSPEEPRDKPWYILMSLFVRPTYWRQLDNRLNTAKRRLTSFAYCKGHRPVFLCATPSQRSYDELYMHSLSGSKWRIRSLKLYCFKLLHSCLRCDSH